jgi:hypothetical protein
MPLNAAGQCWAVLRVGAGGGMPSGKLGCVLKFTLKEIDPATGDAEEEGYEDEYQVRACEGGGCGERELRQVFTPAFVSVIRTHRALAPPQTRATA